MTPSAARIESAAGNTSRRQVLTAAAGALVAGAMPAFAAPSERRLRWLAFYGQSADPRAFAPYDLVVLDPMFDGAIATVAEAGARVCGHLSLGEISSSNIFFDRLDPVSLLSENGAWPGVRRIDVRAPAWSKLVLEEIIPFIISKGFTGVMLDTLDTPSYLEQTDPNVNRGMHEAAVGLVRAIRAAYPGVMLVINRGYALLASVAGSIDAIVAESLLTSPDEREPGRYKWNEPALVQLQFSLLRPACVVQPCMPILSLDYWTPDDTQTIREIYLRQRELGHLPYVATPTLDRIIPEPPAP